MHIDTTKQEPLLNSREVARRLRVDMSTVRGWVKDGILEAIPLPTRGRRRCYRFRESVIDAIYENHSNIGGNVSYDAKQ
jgi:predicted site-specific integrase-resolvase